MAHIKLDLGMQSLGRELDTQFGVIFDGREDLEKFAELYKDLNNHSRKWANRGQTPRESSKRNLKQTVIPEAGSPLMNGIPKQNQPIRVEKSDVTTLVHVGVGRSISIVMEDKKK